MKNDKKQKKNEQEKKGKNVDIREKSGRQKGVAISKRQKGNDNEEKLKTQKKKDANNSNNTGSNKHKLIV